MRQEFYWKTSGSIKWSQNDNQWVVKGLEKEKYITIRDCYKRQLQNYKSFGKHIIVKKTLSDLH